MTATAVPQHMAALDRANRVRVARAELRREIHALSTRDGVERIAELFEAHETPQTLASVRIGVMLGWIRRVGPTYTRELLIFARGHTGGDFGRLSETRRFDSLSERERSAIARALRAGR